MGFKHSALLKEQTEGQPPAQRGVSLVLARKGPLMRLFADLGAGAGLGNSAGSLGLTEPGLGV